MSRMENPPTAPTMKILSLALVMSAALIGLGLHSLGRGIAESGRNRDFTVDHKILFETNDPFPKQLDVNLGIKGEGSPALHIRVDQ